MDQKEREILEHEAGVRQSFLVERLKRFDREIQSLIEGLQAVSAPSEEMAKLPMEKRLRQREIALSILAGGSLASNAVQMCDDATAQKTFYEVIRAFTERLWERED